MQTIQKVRRSQLDRTAETQSILIGATVRLLATVGFAKTTTQLIAKQAGVTTGALHHHFATKDDLMLAVLDRSSILVEERLEGEAGTPLTGPGAIRQVVDHLWQIYGQPDYWAVWEIIIGTRGNPALHQRVLQHRSESMAAVVLPWLKRIEGLAGSTASGVDTFEFMLIAVRGLSLERFMDKDAGYFDKHLSILAAFVDFRLEAERKKSAD